MPALSANTQRDALPPVKKKQILVVEDQPVAAEVVKQILTDLNYEVEIAANGSSALHLAKQKHHDLIFMDIGLPDIDGYEVTRQIRLYEGLSDHKVPIIALTAHADRESKELCLTAGMNAVLTKPLLKKQAAQILEVFLPQTRNSEIDVPQNATTDLSKEEVVNFAIAKSILGSEEIIKKVLTMLAKNLAEERSRLDEAHVKKDWKKIQDIAHKFSGGASYCGALRLKEACEMLKNCIANNNLALYETYYQKMCTEMLAVVQYVENISL